jgi:conjugal transfer/type IV secretion protein DotA/TraY
MQTSSKSFLCIRPLLLLAAVLAVLTLAPVTARAQGAPSPSQLFSLSNGADAPIQWIENIFLGNTSPDPETFLTNTGTQNDNASGFAQSGLQAVLTWYSYAMLVLASFLMLYHLLRIIAETAHTGKPGGRANQLWGAIRMVIAIGLLVPLPSGLNTGQMVVLNLAKQGSALASNAWQQFTTAYLQSFANAGGNGNNGVFVAGSASDGTRVLQGIFLSFVCQDAINLDVDSMPNATQYAIGYYGPAVNNSSPGASMETMSWGYSGNTSYCGSISYYMPVASTTGDGAVVAAAVTAQYQALTTAMGSLQTLACTYVQAVDPAGSGTSSGTSSGVSAWCPRVNNPPLPPDPSSFQAIVTAYNNQLSAAPTAALSAAAGQIQTTMQQNSAYGWLQAGSLFLTFARLQEDVLNVSGYLPQPGSPALVVNPSETLDQAGYEQHTGPLAGSISNIGLGWLTGLAGVIGISSIGSALPGTITEDTSSVLAAAQGWFNNSSPTGAAASTGAGMPSGSGSASSSGTLQGTMAGNTAISAPTGKLSNFIGKIVSAVEGAGLGQNSPILTGHPVAGFPIMVLQSLGWDLLTVAAYMYAGGVFGGIFSSTAGSLAILFGSVLVVPGILLAYVLPLLPFFRFLFAIFGWVLAVIEAVVCVPVFALAHLNPDGEGIMPQSSRSGYMLLMHLLFRPLLIIVGFIAALLLMNGMFDFLNAVWFPTVLGASGTALTIAGNGAGSTSTVSVPTTINPFSGLVYGVIYAGLTYTICNMCFKAIDHIPNHTMRWIGGQGDQHSSEHGPHIEQAMMATAYAGKQVGQTVGGLGTRVLGGHSLGQRVRNKMFGKATEPPTAEKIGEAVASALDKQNKPGIKGPDVGKIET